ncbi:MAG TPA: AAA family ATPase [Pyrinomonadaceae bacterium]|nr:AAA family ATPase [Pyrinomonadaceae bacterium]
MLTQAPISKPEAELADLTKLLSGKVVGQSQAMNAIVPYVYMYQSGLAPEGRPAAIFLLLGPTGTGKTKTVEAIAELLHGSEKKLLKIDCGEFQMDHETAKLVGAPPGYLGHRETVPLLTQQQLTDATSERCDLALVLFDEIEKAAPSITSLLLGILDKGILRLGDNSVVNFEKSLIFFTSNLGAREMLKEINPHIGFQSGSSTKTPVDLSNKIQAIGLGAVRKRFSPEFVNRIDAVVTYRPLDAEALELILDHDVRNLQKHVNSRLGERCFQIEVTPDSREFLLQKGVSQEYGARELKRTVHRELTQPLATMVARSEIGPGAMVHVGLDAERHSLVITADSTTVKTTRPRPSILIADDNRDLLLFMASEMRDEGWEMLTAESAAGARELFRRCAPDTILLDYLLGEDDGLKLAIEFSAQSSATQIIMMTGGGLSQEERTLCEKHEFPILYKPFLTEDVLRFLRGRLNTDAVSNGVEETRTAMV